MAVRLSVVPQVPEALLMIFLPFSLFKLDNLDRPSSSPTFLRHPGLVPGACSFWLGSSVLKRLCGSSTVCFFAGSFCFCVWFKCSCCPCKHFYNGSFNLCQMISKPVPSHPRYLPVKIFMVLGCWAVLVCKCERHPARLGFYLRPAEDGVLPAPFCSSNSRSPSFLSPHCPWGCAVPPEVGLEMGWSSTQGVGLGLVHVQGQGLINHFVGDFLVLARSPVPRPP